SRPRGDRGARDRARDLRRLPGRRHARPTLPRAPRSHAHNGTVTIDELTAADWPAVARIFEEGLGQGTFEEAVPSWQQFDERYLVAQRIVARDAGTVLGWAALSPVSRRECYRGVTEDSVYVTAGA